MPRILVVDDYPDTLISLKAVLEMEGFEVETSSNGSEALEKIRTLYFDLVISDIEMPEITGIELVKRIRDQFPDFPIILMSCSLSKYFEEIDKLKINGCLEKPFGIGVLIYCVQRALNTSVQT